MQTFIYDGSFPGFLTAVFETYEYKVVDLDIISSHNRQEGLFGKSREIYTNDEKALRVITGLKKRLSTQAFGQIYKTFLSEKVGMENMLLAYIRYAFNNSSSIENDYSNSSVLYVTDTAKKVHREKHRMEAFVRFKKTKDGIFYATIEPDFNVLPLICGHFEKRYADQPWLIYDLKRSYGIYYDLKETTIIDLELKQLLKHINEKDLMDVSEEKYEKLWQDYFNSVNIKERKNKKLHQRHMPLRYWKYLIEKKVFKERS